jgi:general secretion pathway protein D
LDIDFNPTGANDSEYDKVIDPKIFQHFRAKLIRRGGTAISTDKFVLSSTLDFLEKQDFTKTIASPSIRTLDGEKASINIVSSKPVQYAKPITATNAQGQPTIEVTYDWQTINYGVKLEVEPIIHEDDEITMKLNISKDAPSNKVEGLDNTFRYESSSNSIDTIVRVKD